MTDNDQEFVTVSQAARLLDMPERTAHRHAAKLSATDRHLADSGRQLVRLSALASISGRTIPPPVADTVADTTATSGSQSTPMADTGSQEESPGLSAVVDMLQAALEREREEHRADLLQARADLEHEREQHKADVERWSKAHDQGQQLHLATVGELQRWQQRASELESANQKLIAAMEAPAVEPDPTPDTATSAPGSPETSRENDKRAKAPLMTEAQTNRFWAFFLGRRKE